MNPVFEGQKYMGESVCTTATTFLGYMTRFHSHCQSMRVDRRLEYFAARVFLQFCFFLLRCFLACSTKRDAYLGHARLFCE